MVLVVVLCLDLAEKRNRPTGPAMRQAVLPPVEHVVDVVLSDPERALYEHRKAEASPTSLCKVDQFNLPLVATCVNSFTYAFDIFWDFLQFRQKSVNFVTNDQIKSF